MQKIILENVIVKGFDPEFVQERMSKNGKPYTKSFVSVQTTDEQKDLIFNALQQNAPYYNANGENVFDKFGKIPAWNELGEKIEQPLNFEFIADVSIMVDYSGGFVKTECLGIKFKSKVDGGMEINLHKNETFEEIFTPDTVDYTVPATPASVQPTQPELPEQNEVDDLPF
jgi:hypothetical protein